MSTLKRKDAPGGNPPPKQAKNTKEARPSKKDTPNNDAKPAAKPEKAPAVVSLLKDEEPMFPRGGASILTPLEQKQIQLEAKADALRDEEFTAGGKTQKKQKRKSTLSKAEKKSDKKKNAEQEDTVKVDSLSFKVGYSSWGKSTFGY